MDRVSEIGFLRPEVYARIDDVLWIFFFVAILNEAFRSADHKTFFLVLFYDAHRTLTLPGHFGMTGLKLGWMGKTAGQS